MVAPVGTRRSIGSGKAHVPVVSHGGVHKINIGHLWVSPDDAAARRQRVEVAGVGVSERRGTSTRKRIYTYTYQDKFDAKTLKAPRSDSKINARSSDLRY